MSLDKTFFLSYKENFFNSLRFLLGFIKKNPWNLSMLVISLVTLCYVIRAYKTPAEVHCEFDMIQRPDSVFQAQIYIWNSGEEIAQDINFHANKQKVFLSDTSKKNPRKLSLLVYPYLSVYATLTPAKILNHLGKEVSFNNYKFHIPQLHPATSESNYFIVLINSRDRRKLINSKNSIYFDKFCLLKTIGNRKNFIEEILGNVKIYYAGKILYPKLRNVLWLPDFDSSKYLFPSLKDVASYPKKATAPDYLLPPLNILNVINDRNEQSGGYKKYKGYRGYKTW